MNNKLTLAAAAIFTAALFGMNAPSATAQNFGGFLNVNTNGVSISLGTNSCTCHSAYTFRNERRRVWCAETYRNEWVPAAYRTDYDRYGNGVRVLVRAGFNRRICVPGHWDYVDHRVRVRRPGHFCRVHHRGLRGIAGIFNRGHRDHGRSHRNDNRRGNRNDAGRGGNRNRNNNARGNRGNGNRNNGARSGNRNRNVVVANRGNSNRRGNGGNRR